MAAAALGLSLARALVIVMLFPTISNPPSFPSSLKDDLNTAMSVPGFNLKPKTSCQLDFRPALEKQTTKPKQNKDPEVMHIT